MSPADIVKVQVAQFPPGAPALVYARGRYRLSQQQLPSFVLAALNGDPKGYFEARWIGPANRWAIGRRIEDQDW